MPFITVAARNIHRSGCSLRDLQLLGGIRSFETTERYVALPTARPGRSGGWLVMCSKRLESTYCSATRVALEADRADGENDSKRKIAQGSISPTASAAAYRSQTHLLH